MTRVYIYLPIGKLLRLKIEVEIISLALFTLISFLKKTKKNKEKIKKNAEREKYGLIDWCGGI